MLGFGVPLAVEIVTVPADVWALIRRNATEALATYEMYSTEATNEVAKPVQKR